MEMKIFHKRIFAKSKVNPISTSNLIHITNLPKLTEAHKLEMDREISIEELGDIENLNIIKAPILMAPQMNFKIFWPKLGNQNY